MLHAPRCLIPAAPLTISTSLMLMQWLHRRKTLCAKCERAQLLLEKLGQAKGRVAAFKCRIPQ